MSAIVTALQSLSQLILTCDIGLTKNEKLLLAQLGDILAPESDHLAYRQALKNVKSLVAIPWLGARTPSLPAFYKGLIPYCPSPFSLLPDLGRLYPYSHPSA